MEGAAELLGQIAEAAPESECKAIILILGSVLIVMVATNTLLWRALRQRQELIDQLHLEDRRAIDRLRGTP